MGPRFFTSALVLDRFTINPTGSGLATALYMCRPVIEDPDLFSRNRRYRYQNAAYHGGQHKPHHVPLYLLRPGERPASRIHAPGGVQVSPPDITGLSANRPSDNMRSYMTIPPVVARLRENFVGILIK